MAGRFRNKVLMITGAAGGVGRGVVEKFHTEGARLVLIDRQRASCEALVSDLGIAAADCLILGGDLGQVEAMDRIVSEVEAKFGQIDGLAHIAGGFGMGEPVHAVNIDVFEKMMYINARLTYVTCGRVAKHMVDRGVKGSIVTVLAKAGLSGGKNMAAYVASKAAAERIVQSMALELREHDIRVNGIMPSIVDTPTNRKDMPNADFGRWVTPAQIADTIAYLLSDDASAVSGASVPVYNRVM